MMTNSVVGENKNLARKWRCKQFDQLVGQDIPVRMLKNALFKNYWYPVYLFSGTHGCGKTTTARMFAAAVNCVQLSVFQQNPRTQIMPCMNCESCRLMSVGRHPDFIEIDGASNTGVDNIRAVIEAASLLPVLGKKKIYLIDEAHMLSRAAFNSFLKILEEPPASTFFILATTDPAKIIETVKSRCFEVQFKAVPTEALADYLAYVCEQESISYAREGLVMVARAANGCVRDALNIIEQVRMAATAINPNTVRSVLGHLDMSRVISLVECVIDYNVTGLIALLKDISVNLYSVEQVWRDTLFIVRTLIDMQYGIPLHESEEFLGMLKPLVSRTPQSRLIGLLTSLYDAEERLLKTRAQNIFFEMICIRLCTKGEHERNGSNSAAMPTTGSGRSESILPVEQDSDVDDSDTVDEADETADGVYVESKWRSFVQAISSTGDLLLHSVFSQVTAVNLKNEVLEITLPTELHFLSTVIVEEKKVWQPLAINIFGNSKIELKVLFSAKLTQQAEVVIATDGGPIVAATQIPEGDIVSKERLSSGHGMAVVTKATAVEKKLNTHRNGLTQQAVNRSSSSATGKGTNASCNDPIQWPKTHMVLTCFSGNIEGIDG